MSNFYVDYNEVQFIKLKSQVMHGYEGSFYIYWVEIIFKNGTNDTIDFGKDKDSAIELIQKIRKFNNE